MLRNSGSSLAVVKPLLANYSVDKILLELFEWCKYFAHEKFYTVQQQHCSSAKRKLLDYHKCSTIKLPKNPHLAEASLFILVKSSFGFLSGLVSAPALGSWDFQIMVISLAPSGSGVGM